MNGECHEGCGFSIVQENLLTVKEFDWLTKNLKLRMIATTVELHTLLVHIMIIIGFSLVIYGMRTIILNNLNRDLKRYVVKV